MSRLFGTDGVRGIANDELSPELAFRLGRAGAAVLTRHSLTRPRVLIGRDTRISGQMLEASLASGVASVGCDVETLGIVPTPGVAYLTRRLNADAGVMISASHNPVEDNGIKFFARDGFKLPDEVEDEIEALLTGQPVSANGTVDDGLPRPTGSGVGRIWDGSHEVSEYVRHAAATCGVRLDGLRVVVDCANGAASSVAPEIYALLGAEVVAIANEPDGININHMCGSTHPQSLQAEVVRCGAHLGIAHDGDSDRVIAAAEDGSLIDGDYIMAICGKHLIESDKLPTRTIVATPYSNLGLSKVFEDAGGKVVLAKNGDRYVLEEMRKRDLPMGGEQSGHIIFLEFNTTGDGIITALQLMAVMVRSGASLSELAGTLTKYPQILKNVKVSRKAELAANLAISTVIEEAEATLGSRGRVFVRASGTEPLIRVMVESPDESECRGLAEKIACVIEGEIG